MLDRYLGHGYNVSGLAPSTYERRSRPACHGLPDGLADAARRRPHAARDRHGVALAAVPLLPGGDGGDRAVRAVRAARPRRGGCARSRPRAAASAALLYGYALWGGIKELAEAALLVLDRRVAARVPPGAGRLAALPLAVAAAATVGVQSAAGAAWLAVPALIAAVVLWRRPGPSVGVEAAVALVVARRSSRSRRSRRRRCGSATPGLHERKRVRQSTAARLVRRSSASGRPATSGFGSPE